MGFDLSGPGFGFEKENGPGAWLAGVGFGVAYEDEKEAKGLGAGAVESGAAGAPPKLPPNMEENGLPG